MQHIHHSFIQTKYQQALICLICIVIGSLVAFVFGFFWRTERAEPTTIRTALVLKVRLPETITYHATLRAQTDPQFIELVIQNDGAEPIQLGQRVELKAQSSDSKVLFGQIQTLEQHAKQLYLGVVLDQGQTRVDLDEARSISIRIQPAKQREVLLVPNQAIQQQAGRTFVEIRWAEGEPAVPIAVETGASQAGYTEIVSCSEIGWQCLELGDEVLLRAAPES